MFHYIRTPSKINLIRMKKLKKNIILLQFSDHSIGVNACKIAITEGATVIEKHFTYNQK